MRELRAPGRVVRARRHPRGALLLHEMSDGSPAQWYHRICAAPTLAPAASLEPADTLHPMFHRPDVFGDVDPRHLRKRVNEMNRALRSEQTGTLSKP